MGLDVGTVLNTDLKELGCKGLDLELSGSEWSPMVDSCEYGNESLGFLKDAKFLDQLKDYGLLKKCSTLWNYDGHSLHLPNHMQFHISLSEVAKQYATSI
jgi:hypothetical protein